MRTPTAPAPLPPSSGRFVSMCLPLSVGWFRRLQDDQRLRLPVDDLPGSREDWLVRLRHQVAILPGQRLEDVQLDGRRGDAPDLREGPPFSRLHPAQAFLPVSF